MAIIRMDPLTLFNKNFFRPIIDDLNREWPLVQMTEGLDVYEENDNIVVKAALPGVSESNIKVTFEDGVLHITGQEEDKKEGKKGKQTIYRKDRVASFDYICTLPRPIDPEKISAEMKNGVIIVTAPIAVSAKAKTIPVKVRK